MSANGVAAIASPTQPSKLDHGSAATGLTSDEARVRLDQDGPNAMPDTSDHPVRAGAKIDHMTPL
jgi:hypothetical protein